MAKIGRNQPCLCGSGSKYKKCHGALPVGDAPMLPFEAQAGIDQKSKSMEALRVRREKQQGLGRPIVAFKMQRHQMVFVGNRMHSSPNWKTFHDFLRDFLFGLFGKEWLEAERAKRPADHHRILQWFDQGREDTRRDGTKHGEVYIAPMTGAIRAFTNLAYNIYLIAHHTEEADDRIVKSYIERLKSSRADDFTGALFETYAAAAFLKAGFKLEFENE
jgi:hypothetical protein